MLHSTPRNCQQPPGRRHTEEEMDTNTRAPPLRPNKRQHITLNYADTESFPPLNAKQDQADQSFTQPRAR
eukprot:scaffold108620_cov83-Attheya_sp.AAC.1